jgi:hypothetical protein
MILKLQRMSDLQVFNYKDKSDKDNSETNDNMCPPSGPYSYTILSCKTGCTGCNEWEKHSGTDCKEMAFCCIPFALITDTLCLPYTIVKCLCCKKK